MRDIKFRAWYNQTNEMINWNEIQECVRNIDWDDFMADCELMQFTGLKDKNGVDIYECDIVNLDFRGISKQIIEFESGMYKVGGISLCTFTPKNVEVIGNVHENQDLLTAGDRT